MKPSWFLQAMAAFSFCAIAFTGSKTVAGRIDKNGFFGLNRLRFIDCFYRKRAHIYNHGI
jgi:hypothetical protein